MQQEITLTLLEDKGYQILFQQQQIGFMDFYGYIDITNPKIIQNKKFHHEVRTFCKDFLNKVVNEEVAKLIEEKNGRYEIVAREYETSGIRSYKFFNLKKEAQTVAEIVESRKVNCYDDQIPIQHFLKIYRKSMQKDKFLPINELVEKMSKLDEQQFNSILMAYALRIDQKHIDEMLSLELSAKQCFIYIQIILFDLKPNIQEYLINLLKLDLPEKLVYSLFIYFLYSDNLEFTQLFVDSYLADTSNSDQMEEIVLSFLNGLNLQDILEDFKSIPTKNELNQKRITLQHKQYIESNLPNIEKQTSEYLGKNFTSSSQFKLNKLATTDQKQEPEKTKFTWFQRKESKQDSDFLDDFIPSKLSYGEVDLSGSRIFYDGKLIAIVNLDGQFILLDEYKYLDDDITKQIEQFAVFMTSEKEGLFKEYLDKLINEYEIIEETIVNKIVFNLKNKDTNHIEIIGEINEIGELFVLHNVYKFAKEYMVSYWLFDYKKADQTILNKLLLHEELKDMLIQSILQGYTIEDLKYLLYLADDKKNLVKLFQFYRLRNCIKTVKMEYNNIQKQKEISILEQANFTNSIDQIFEDEYNFFSKYYLTDGKIKTEISTYKFQIQELLSALKEELKFNQYMLAKKKIKEFLLNETEGVKNE